jgi:5-dehydro-2-deoxygluconokinase
VSEARPDVVVIGRVCIDLYPTEPGIRLEEVRRFSKSIGGSSTNVAVAASRHGLDVTMVTRTGDDPFGRYVVEEFTRFGVNAQRNRPVTGIPSVLTFCEMFPPDDFPLYIWRNPTAPDMFLDVDDLPMEDIALAQVLWVTATGLSREPSRSAHMAALEERGRITHTVLDLDYRPMFWESAEQASLTVAPALDHVTIAIGNAEECEVAVGERDPDRAADALLERGVELAIVKRGKQGVLAKTRDERIQVPPIPVDVVNGLGAGDAFGGALCRGLIEEWPLGRTLRFANAAGAIVATRHECSTAMPTSDEVDSFLEERATEI